MPVGRTTPTTVSTTETTPDSFLSQPGRPRELSQNCTIFTWSNRGEFMWGTTQSMLLDTLLQTPLRLEIREKTWALDRVCEVAFNLAPTFNATVEKAAYRIISDGNVSCFLRRTKQYTTRYYISPASDLSSLNFRGFILCFLMLFAPEKTERKS